MDIGQPTLDQLRIFLAVADAGSFNQAARRLGRALSVISYGISTLEGQLGVRLFEREGSARPVLTDAGKALLTDARAIADEADSLIARVRGIRQGLETVIALAVDVMVPTAEVSAVLREFQATFPTVDLHLHIEALGAVAALVCERQADLAISGPAIADLPELQQKALGCVKLIPVAAPSHPLGQATGILPGEAARHLQLVLSDRSPLTQGRDFSVLSPRTWRLGDLGAKHALLLEGIGWGNMPRHRIAADVAAGRLVELGVPEAPQTDYPLHALWRKDNIPGPAATWLLQAIEARFQTAGPVLTDRASRGH